MTDSINSPPSPYPVRQEEGFKSVNLASYAKASGASTDQAVLDRLDRGVALLEEILAELRGQPRSRPKRSKHSSVRDQALAYVTRKLRDAGPLGVEWKKIRHEAEYLDRIGISDRTLRNARKEVGFPSYREGTCFWALKPGIIPDYPEA